MKHEPTRNNGFHGEPRETKQNQNITEEKSFASQGSFCLAHGFTTTPLRNLEKEM